MKQFKGFERKEAVEWEQLPKGAYVIKILNVKEEANKNGPGSHLAIAFDVAEGEYAGIYKRIFDNNTKEDKKWPNDAVVYINCPQDNSDQWIVDAFNKFMTAVEDSNEGYHWGWDEKTLKGKLVGAKFYIEQSEYNGNIYDHTKAKWFLNAQKVRDGKYGKLPNDKLIGDTTKSSSGADGFVNVPDNITDEEVPFD
jgi:hypothetical protein